MTQHLQTEEDFQRVIASVTTSSQDLRGQIRQDKADRPLLHGELVRWLVDRGQQEGLTGPEQEARLIACGFDWEGNGVLSQSGMHEILRLLGYLRG